MELQFKYQKEIDALLAEGCQMPKLYAPNDSKLVVSLFQKKVDKTTFPNI